MRKFMIIGLIAATMFPVAAQAQSQAEVRRDRQDLREERRELDRAYRRGDPQDIRREQRDVRDARRELREDVYDRNRAWGRYDWRQYRDTNRALYARGTWRAPFRYTSFRVGRPIAPAYYSSRYVILDPWRYHLPPTRGYQRWVRHYNDVLLVDTRRGVVIDVYRGFYF